MQEVHNVVHSDRKQQIKLPGILGIDYLTPRTKANNVFVMI